MKSVILIPRIKCECGWYNDRPPKKLEQTETCKNCGKVIIKEYRTVNKKREFEFELHKALFKLRRKEVKL